MRGNKATLITGKHLLQNNKSNYGKINKLSKTIHQQPIRGRFITATSEWNNFLFSFAQQSHSTLKSNLYRLQAFKAQELRLLQLILQVCLKKTRIHIHVKKI